MKPPLLEMVVAVDASWGIGQGGGMPWSHNKHEMQHFAALTKGALGAESTPTKNIVLMGAGTWDSLPARARPLKDRVNVIMTTKRGAKDYPSDCHVVGSFDEGMQALINPIKHLKLERQPTRPRAFVIGGEQIHRQFIPHVQVVHLSVNHHTYACDRFFPRLTLDQWGVVAMKQIDEDWTYVRLVRDPCVTFTEGDTDVSPLHFGV